MEYQPTRPFSPRWGLANGHLQTIWATYFPYKAAAYHASTHEIQLTDGDRLIVHEDRPASWNSGDRVVILVHGLGGSHLSNHVVRVTDKLEQQGQLVLRMDQRGWGASKEISTGYTHAGRSDDLLDVVRYAADRFPASPITVIGFSLGANITLKFGGEFAHELPEAVDSLLAVAPPIDLMTSSDNIRSFSNWVYDRTFVRQLNRLLVVQRDKLLATGRVTDLKPARNLYDFDDRITARLAGYENAAHYYQSCSSAPLLEKIELPTLIVTAEDDPLIPFSMFRAASFGSSTQVLSVKTGGHLGFLGRDGVDPDPFWLDWRIAEWVQAIDSCCSSRD